MGNRIINLASPLFVFILIGCIHFSPRVGGVLEIKDFRESGIPAINLSTHQDQDVEVNKTISWVGGEAYEIVFYRVENDTLRYFKVIYGSEDEFDKAAYKWKNDTTVLVRLLSPFSNKKATMKVWGKGPRTEVEVMTEI